MNDSLAESPIFIGGYPRSGTTLLVALLDSHPDLLVYPSETLFFSRTLPRFRRDPAAALDATLQTFNDRTWYLKQFGAAPDGSAAFARYVRRLFVERGATPKALLQAIVLAYGEATGQLDRRFWVEKTPHNERYADRIFAWFPNAKLIYIVRDPRATLASARGFQRITKEAPLPTLRFCAEWLASLAYARRAARTGWVFTVLYEDLVRTPEVVLPRLCTFLGIPFHETLLHPTINQAGFSGFSSYSGFRTSFTSIDPSSLDRWRDQLPAADAALIELLLAKPMARFGYRRAYPQQPLPALRHIALYTPLVLAGSWLLQMPAPVWRTVRTLLRAGPSDQILETLRRVREDQG